MRLLIDKEKLGNNNIKVLMNRLGYYQHFDRNTNQVSYIRRFGRLDYPRFHIYIDQRNNSLSFNLHLDEKKPSYQGYHAHSGEYEGDVVQAEAERIKGYLQNL